MVASLQFRLCSVFSSFLHIGSLNPPPQPQLQSLPLLPWEALRSEIFSPHEKSRRALTETPHHLHRGPGREVLSEVSLVNLVDGGEVLDVCQEDRGLDDVVEGSSR